MAEFELDKYLDITVTGTEGAGKTGQLDILEAHFVALLDRDLVVRTKEPGGTKAGVEMRKLLLDHEYNLPPRAETFLFMADRACLVEEVIVPARKANKVILRDRSRNDTIAYQGYARGLDLVIIDRMNDWATRNLIGVRHHLDGEHLDKDAYNFEDYGPELTIWFDLPPEVGLVRKKGQPEQWSKFEAEELPFHSRVRQGLAKLAEQNPAGFIIVNADQPFEDVSTEMLQKLDGWLQDRRPVTHLILKQAQNRRRREVING